jgi:hypothetical protein
VHEEVEPLDEYFEISEYNRTYDFRFEMVKFKDSMIGPSVADDGSLKVQRVT